MQSTHLLVKIHKTQGRSKQTKERKKDCKKMKKERQKLESQEKKTKTLQRQIVFFNVGTNLSAPFYLVLISLHSTYDYI